MLVKCGNPEEVVKEAFWLAWNACGCPQGMGVFQDNPRATKEAVINNIVGRGDYPGGIGASSRKSKDLYADYVFGRMMKVGFRWNDEGVEVSESAPQWDYQGWCGKYPTYMNLVEAAIKSVNS